MANLFLLLVVLLLFALAIYLFWKDKQITRMEQMRIQKLRGSEFYARIFPTLRRLSRQGIESVRIRPQDVCVTLTDQPGRACCFDLQQMGYRCLTDAQMTALVLALERDLGVLADRSRYRMRREVRTLINGDKVCQYTYVIRHTYKDAISRAAYYGKAA